SKLGEALTYTHNQKPFIMNYLLDGHLEASNNLAERSIKPFVIDRKNFLFANTPAGAEASAITFSIIETAKANGLDPFRYLTYIFKTAPGLDQSQPDWATPLLPWNAPDDCSVPS
ncbi:MAG: transposase, partial [Oscillospiraceae bacterium]|nr:transposase [Oscillospiraceae bacterium]